GLRPVPSAEGWTDPYCALTLFIDAQASISVPSTEKWSLDRSRLTLGWARTAARNFAAMSPSSSRSRFLENVEWSHARLSTPMPTNQRNSRSYSKPLHQEPLRADRVERLKEHRPQQLLRRDRRPPDRRIERRELTLERAESLIHDRPDRTQWMIAPNPRLQIHIAEQFASSIVVAAHAP